MGLVSKLFHGTRRKVASSGPASSARAEFEPLEPRLLLSAAPHVGRDADFVPAYLGFNGDTYQYLRHTGGDTQTGDATPTGLSYLVYNEWGGGWSDAEKSPSNSEDDLLCWAAAASNILEWTGWGQGDGMTDTDQIFQYFQDHWTDQGGLPEFGWDWWFDGTNDSQGWSGWSQVDVAGGGFFLSENFAEYYQEDFSDYYSGGGGTPQAMATIDEYLHDGYGVALGVYGPGGHAITCWGFNYNPDDPTDYYGIWVTDSDDYKYTTSPPDVLRYYEVEVNDGRWHLQNFYGSDSWYIGGIQAMARRETDPAPEPATVFRADFEDGSGGYDSEGFSYAADPDASTNLWHSTVNRSSSPDHSQYYGQEGIFDYDTGARNAGYLVSPTISLAGAGGSVTLSFDYFLRTESSTDYDRAEVHISNNGGSSWTTLATRSSANGLAYSAGWSRWSGDISDYAGDDIIVRFNFDTGDDMYNNLEGWYIDNVMVTGELGNHAPTLVNPIADQEATEDAAFSFSFAADTFDDEDSGDTLTYTATLANGSSLPDWLTFNPGTRTFSGTPTEGDVGQIAVEVVADDGHGTGAASDGFDLSVTEAYHPPDVTVTLSRGDLVIRGRSSQGAEIEITEGATTDEFIVTGLNDTTVNGQSAVAISGVDDDVRIHMRNGDNNITLSGITVADDLVIRTGRGDDTITLAGVTVADNTRIVTGWGDDDVDLGDSEFSGRVHVRTSAGADNVDLSDSAFGGQVRVNTGWADDSLDVAGCTFATRFRARTSQGTDSVNLLGSNFQGRFKLATCWGNDAVTALNSQFGHKVMLNLGQADDYLRLQDLDAGTGGKLDGGMGTDTYEDAGLSAGHVGLKNFEVFI